jgi:hypothetical protein
MGTLLPDNNFGRTWIPDVVKYGISNLTWIGGFPSMTSPSTLGNPKCARIWPKCYKNFCSLPPLLPAKQLVFVLGFTALGIMTYKNSNTQHNDIQCNKKKMWQSAKLHSMLTPSVMLSVSIKFITLNVIILNVVVPCTWPSIFLVGHMLKNKNLRINP